MYSNLEIITLTDHQSIMQINDEILDIFLEKGPPPPHPLLQNNTHMHPPPPPPTAMPLVQTNTALAVFVLVFKTIQIFSVQ